MSIYYKCISYDTDAYEIKASLDDFNLAKTIAMDYWRNHDGWEAAWPLAFSVHETEDGEEVARYLVEMEFSPEFYGRKVI